MMRKFLSLLIPQKRSLINAKGKKYTTKTKDADVQLKHMGSSIVNNVEGG